MYNYQSLIERVLTPVGKSGNDIIYLCPRCNDKSGHLYVNYTKGFYHCVRCSELKGRNLGKLVEELGISKDYDYSLLEDSNYSNRLDTLIKDGLDHKQKKVLDYSIDLNKLTYFYNCHVKELSVEARNYLHSRGINDYYINLYNIKEGTNLYKKNISIGNNVYEGKDYSNRILVPSMHKNGLISYYVARDYTGNLKPKYLNPPKELAYSSEDVWNLDMVDSNDVVICEGVFSAISVSIALNINCSIATYGKSIALKSNNVNELFDITSQGEKLVSRKFNNYYIFYDADVSNESKLNICKYLSDRGVNVKVVNFDKFIIDKYGKKADTNDMTSDEIKYCLSTAKDFDKFMYLDL